MLFVLCPRYEVVFTDCKPAISIVTQQSQINDYSEVSTRLRLSLQTLNDVCLCISVIWIPSHVGFYIEHADTVAREALYLNSESFYRAVTLPACNRLVSKQIRKQWQQRWDHIPTGRATHALIPEVGSKTFFPEVRCCSISYSRLLLDDTALNAHQHHMVQSGACKCGQGIDDEYHYFFTCPKYNEMTARNCEKDLGEVHRK